MAYFLSPIANSQIIDANGNPLNGGKVYTYLAGTSTPAPTYTSNDGTAEQANPIILNSLGLPENPIWIQGGMSLKFVIKDAGNVILIIIDNILGVNDTGSVALDEWLNTSYTPTYVSATGFSVAGDKTNVLQIGRRVKTANTAGLIYSTILTSSYSAGITTITVSNDSGVLDSGLSLVSYGFLSPVNTSLPNSNAARSALAVPGNSDLFAGATVGNYIVSNNSIQRTTTSTTTVLLKETRVSRAGAYRIRFTLNPLTDGFAAYGRIYKNGVAVGTQRSSATLAPVIFTEDLSGFVAGDLIQVYGYIGTPGFTAAVSFFQLCVATPIFYGENNAY